MDLYFIQSALADAGTPPTPEANPLFTLLPLLIFVGVFYFLILRPQSKRAKEHKTMLEQLARGDEVATVGGFLGKVTEIGDNFIDLEISPNIVVKIQKGTIANILPKGTMRSH